MKKLATIFVVSASTNMIVIILQGRDEIMNDKMEKVVQELRKRFRGSITKRKTDADIYRDTFS